MELGIRGVDGHIDGTDAQVNDALRLPLGEVGEGDVVALQEAEAGVVILKIQGLAHARGHLIHEAEDAVVGARAHLIHEVGVEVQTQILTLGLADGELPGGAVFVFQRQMAHGVVPVKPVVQHVHHGVAIDGQKLLAGAQTGSHGGAIGIYGGDDGAHRCVLSQKTAYCHIITY